MKALSYAMKYLVTLKNGFVVKHASSCENVHDKGASYSSLDVCG
jgi:hypothetical protein